MEAEQFFSEFLNKIPDSFNGATTEELPNLLKFCKVGGRSYRGGSS